MNAMTPTPCFSANGLCPELASILAAELEAGNRVLQWRSSGRERGSVRVLLQQPFLSRHSGRSERIAYRETNDPTWWMAEYVDEATRDCVACGF